MQALAVVPGVASISHRTSDSPGPAPSSTTRDPPQAQVVPGLVPSGPSTALCALSLLRPREEESVVNRQVSLPCTRGPRGSPQYPPLVSLAWAFLTCRPPPPESLLGPEDPV